MSITCDDEPRKSLKVTVLYCNRWCASEGGHQKPLGDWTGALITEMEQTSELYIITQ